MKILFSAEYYKNSDHTNKVNLMSCGNSLDRLGISYTMVEGCYKGECETTFMIDNVTVDSFEAIKSLCSDYSQHSLLIVRDDDSAALFYIETESFEELGTFGIIDLTDEIEVYTMIEGFAYSTT